MLRFEHATYLYALLLVGVLIGAFFVVVRWKSGVTSGIGNPDLVSQLFQGYSPERFKLKFVLIAVALAMLVLGAANLQQGDKMERITRKGVDVMIALDVSKSMLATDVQPSRLDRAKQLISKLLDGMGNNRVGLVLFAGNAYLQMPLTVDFDAARMYLSTAGPQIVPSQGTAIDKAIAMCDRSFSQNEKLHKAIVLISDGEDWDEGAIQAARQAHDQDGIVIHTVGVGTTEGAPILDPSTGDYKRDARGQLILTRMNPKEMQAIAAAGHGTYQYLDNPDQVAIQLEHQLDAMQKNVYGENLYSDYISYFQYFLAVGLLLLAAEFFIPETSMSLWNKA